VANDYHDYADDEASTMKNDSIAPLLRAKEGTCSLTDVSSVTRARVRPVPPVACHRIECVQGKEKTGVLMQGRNDEIEQRMKENGMLQRQIEDECVRR
jgi:hypothetical protein